MKKTHQDLPEVVKEVKVGDRALGPEGNETEPQIWGA